MIAPFLIGLAGSLHCIGMCGPLSAAITNARGGAMTRRLIYNGGRIFTYGLLGALFSSLGTLSSLLGIQSTVSIALGVVLIGVGIIGIRLTLPGAVASRMRRITEWLQRQFAVLLKSHKGYSVFAMGMLNGLLPCGMTLVAFGYCISLATPLDGFVAMLSFGLGTLPSMIGAATFIKVAFDKLPFTMRQGQVALLVISGILLIGRAVQASGGMGDGTKVETVCK